MSEKDKQLLKDAEQITNCILWFQVLDLEEQAESKEAKDILHRRRCELYHREEYKARSL